MIIPTLIPERSIGVLLLIAILADRLF